MKTILNIANRLPVTIEDNGVRQSSGGLVSALDGVSGTDVQLQWFGWPGPASEDANERAALARQLAEEFGYRPVFLSGDEIEGYYDGFSNSSLWPILHYNSGYMRYADSDWEMYRSVNERFAEAILEVASDDDIVWVHDYHLMLVPSLLREAKAALRIGFFFHTPFPSSEVFRCHPRCVELIQGVLGADLIGFHTFNYQRHFRSSALRLVGLESEMGAISQGNHRSTLGVYPIGINSGRFQEELESPPFAEHIEEFRSQWEGKRIVLSVERLDYSKGLLRRVEAIEEFLSRCETRDDIVFVFVSVPSRGEVVEYKLLREQLEGEIGRINGLYASTRNNPIHFIHQSVPFTELCALYALADCALVTPLVDGMNLVAKEYVACQGDDPGVLILSEFAGAAQELLNALIVNPFDTRAVAVAIETALGMELEERAKRMKYMHSRVTQFDSQYWATTYLRDLVELEQFTENPMSLSKSEDTIVGRIANAERVGLFLDYDGTLREFERLPDRAYPNEAIIEVLEALAARDVDVYIISGRKSTTLQRWFEGFAFTIIAEHGNAFRRADGTEWESLNPSTDYSWKPRVMEIMRHYEGSTPGSFVEEKRSAIVWHYRQSDPEFGQWKAHQLLSDAYEMLANLPLEIHHGKKIVEVSSIHVNKGAAVKSFLEKNAYDLALCAGDDQTDEAMFRLEPENLLSIKVGAGESRADYRIPDPERFRRLLLRIAEVLPVRAEVAGA